MQELVLVLEKKQELMEETKKESWMLDKRKHFYVFFLISFIRCNLTYLGIDRFFLSIIAQQRGNDARVEHQVNAS